MHHNKEKREPEHPAELETHFVLRLPVEPAKALREVLESGDNLKNRLTIKVEDDMRHGEVRFDHWLMNSKIVDLPTIIESLKTIDNKSFYKSADLCQMMICKEEPDPTTTEDEVPMKNKKKDPYKVDKKFLWPHGVTPPTKNVRKRRFRKTLRKKTVEAPEIEKEVKRLLRADNEAVSVTWEIIQDDEDQHPKPEQSKPVNKKSAKKKKAARNLKREPATSTVKSKSSEVVDIFGGAVSDSDLDEDNVNVQLEDRQLSAYEELTKSLSMHGLNESSSVGETFTSDFKSHSLQSRKAPVSHTITSAAQVPPKSFDQSSDDDYDYQSNSMLKDDMTLKIEQSKKELEELKQRRQKTQHEISGMENMALKQRFQEILHTLNQDIMFKEMEYQGMLTLQNSEDI